MKIAHISDLHFGYHQNDIVELFLSDIKQSQPDIILISGDMTHRATEQQYNALMTFIQKLPGIVLTVPGNHDIPLRNIFARVFYPFKLYKKYVTKDLGAEFNDKQVNILGVNSVNPFEVKDGALSSKTMDSIKTHFDSTTSKINLVFFHHNLNYLEGMHKPLKNYRQFLSYLKQSPINIVCTGHLHYASIGLLENNNHLPCLLLHAGSLLCKRNRDGFSSYYLIETIEEDCHIDWRICKDFSFTTLKRYSFNFSKHFSIAEQHLKQAAKE
jgi:3',5'-cyclic AMP phosphodiesterase CpdA